VNLIDTADVCGPETSELLIAEALHPYPQGLVIATKGGLTRREPGVGAELSPGIPVAVRG
jgi:aryl-alcohol dehydrogenase-like predicted oxidoreductase